MDDDWKDTKAALTPAAVPETATRDPGPRIRPGRVLALEPLLLSAPEAAHLLSISEATFWRWDSSGELGPRGFKKGGRRLWLLSELRAWTEAGMPRRTQWEAMRAAESPAGR
jgi:predicted DNA-binding transcriptional regulator AlpA